MSFPSDELPPRNSAYAGQFHCLFKLCPWLIYNPVHSQFSDHQPAPRQGDPPQDHSFDSTVEFELGFRLNLGPWLLMIPLPVSGKGTARADVQVVWDGEDAATKTRRYRTELRKLDSAPIRLSLGPFSLSPTPLLRLSTQQASSGTTTVRERPDGRYDIQSHFDVATSVSFDGGRTWHDSEDRSQRPCAAPMDLLPEPRIPEEPIG